MPYRQTVAAAAFAILLPLPAYAGLRIVADIAPLASLAAMVAATDDTVETALPQGESPHHFALRPSHLKMITGADLVVHAGHEISPAVAEAADAAGVAVLELGADHEGGHDDEAGHEDEHHDDGHDDAKLEEDHEGHDDHEDNHAWLNPETAIDWIDDLVLALTAARPEMAEGYAARGATAKADLERLHTELAKTLDASRAKGIGVGHDAFAALAEAYGLTGFHALAGHDDEAPGAASMAGFRDAIRSGALRCLLAENASSARTLEPLAQEYGVTLAHADILGADIEPGPALYGTMMTRIAEAIAACDTAE